MYFFIGTFFWPPLCILSRLVSLSKEFQENPICRLRDGESFLGRIVITMFPMKKQLRRHHRDHYRPAGCTVTVLAKVVIRE